MTPVERALVRDLVARARIERERAVREDDEVGVPSEPRCVYCATWLRSRFDVACTKHRDLLELDPKYALLAAA